MAELCLKLSSLANRCFVACTVFILFSYLPPRNFCELFPCWLRVVFSEKGDFLIIDESNGEDDDFVPCFR